jgi:cytochrome d ubiquinol oxidase subunit I
LVARTKTRIGDGLIAYSALQKLKTDPRNEALRTRFEAHVKHLGYALLLKRIRPDIEKATPAQIQEAANSTIPDVPVLFWSFRIMVALGFFFIALFAAAFYLSAKCKLDHYRWFLWVAFLSLPLPWIAAEPG